MTAVRERAEHVASLPSVKRWIKRFKRLAADMPPEVWVYVASGTPTVMACDENGKHIHGGRFGRDGVDRDGIVDSVDRRGGGGWDGGDW